MERDMSLDYLLKITEFLAGNHEHTKHRLLLLKNKLDRKKKGEMITTTFLKIIIRSSN